MPRIQLPQQPDVIAAPYQGAAPASRAAEFQGQAALAEGIGDAGGAMVQFAQRSQAIKNERDLTNGRLAMQKAQADLQADMEANPDPNQWDQMAEKRFEQVSGSVFASDDSLSPVVRRELENDFKQWANTTSLTVRNQAQRKRNDEADALFVQEQASAISAGNRDAALEVVDKRERLGLLSPQRAKLEREQVAYAVDRQAVASDIDDDPFIALEKLEDTTEGGKPRHYTHLSERDRLAAKRSAKNAMETARAETAQQLQEYILENSGVGAEQKIDTWLEAGRLLPSQAVNLKKFAAGQRKPQEMAATGATLWQAAIDLDRADPDYIQKAMRIRADAHSLDPSVRDPILDTLNGKDRNDVREDIQRTYDALNRDFRANTYGNVQTYTQAEIDGDKKLRKAGKREGDPKDPAAFEQASARLFRYQRAMRDFLQANPKATTDQIQEYKARITAADRQAALGGLMIDALSGSR